MPNFFILFSFFHIKNQEHSGDDVASFQGIDISAIIISAPWNILNPYPVQTGRNKYILIMY